MKHGFSFLIHGLNWLGSFLEEMLISPLLCYGATVDLFIFYLFLTFPLLHVVNDRQCCSLIWLTSEMALLHVALASLNETDEKGSGSSSKRKHFVHCHGLPWRFVFRLVRLINLKPCSSSYIVSSRFLVMWSTFLVNSDTVVVFSAGIMNAFLLKWKMVFAPPNKHESG